MTRNRKPKPIYRERVVREIVAWSVICAVCGTEFESQRSTARTCSDACRMRQSRARRAKEAR